MNSKRWPNRSWKTLSSVAPTPNSIVNRSSEGKALVKQNPLNLITSGAVQPNESKYLIDTNTLALPIIARHVENIQVASNILNTYTSFKPFKIEKLGSVLIALGSVATPYLCTAPDNNIDNNWTQRTLPDIDATYTHDLAASPTAAIVVGVNTQTKSAYISRSTNGTTWTLITPPFIDGFPTYELLSCTYAQGVWLACGGVSDGARVFTCIIYSTDDGLTWNLGWKGAGGTPPHNKGIAITGAKSPVSQGFNFLAYEQANSITESLVLGSYDGVSWEPVATMPIIHTGHITSVGLNIVHNKATNVWTLSNGYYSEDGGYTFKPYPTDSTRFPVRTGLGRDHYLSANRSSLGSLLYSLDGIHFFKFSSPLLQLISNYAFGEPYWHETTASWLLPVNEIVNTNNNTGAAGGAILQLKPRTTRRLEWEFVGAVSKQMLGG